MTANASGLRAAIYVRLSRETEETTSPERQRAACEQLCKARGWDVVFVEEDIDVSGFSKGLDRPGLQRILGRLAEIDVVVFFKIDRLARSTVDFAEIMRITEAETVALASASEPLDLTSSMGRAMAKVIAVFAELESETIGMRVSSAHEHLRREGRWTGGKVPYGYRVIDNPDGAGRVLAINPEERDLLHRVVKRVIDRESIMSIVRWLNEEGIPSPGHESRYTKGMRSKSARWYTATLQQVLRNPQLLGYVIEDGKPILTTDGLPLQARTPVLDMDTWQALQDELERRKQPTERRQAGTSLLRGILHCGVCGYRMYTFTVKGLTRYRCIGRLKKAHYGGQTDCVGISIAGAGTEAFVVAEFLKKFGAMPVVRLVEHAGEDFRPQVRQAQEALKDLETDRYDRGLFKGDDGAVRYAAQYGRLEERLAMLQERQRNAVPAGVERVPTGQTHGELWASADTAGKRELLLNAGAYVEVSPAKRVSRILDTTRIAPYFGELGEMRRADAEGRDPGAVIREMVARDLEL
nr:recombinase family protein [Streptomyces sp. 846.5]